MKDKRHEEKVGDKNIRCLRIVAIHYVSTPNADLRLARAIDILLEAAMKEPEGSTNVKKRKKRPQDNPPEGVAGQSDGGKDGY